MADKEYMYVIGVGSTDDWEAGRGLLYSIEDLHGELLLPVFSSEEELEKHVHNILENPDGYMRMLESAGYSHADALTGGRYTIMPLEWPFGVAAVADKIDADMLLRDPRPGKMQETMRVPKV